MMWALLIGIVLASIGTGFALGRTIQFCEDKECANSKTNTPNTAPGADWGTWS